MSSVPAVFQEVYSRTGYALLSLAVAVLTFLGTALFPHFDLLRAIASDLAALELFRFTVGLLGGVIANSTPISLALTAAIAILFGVYIALLVCHLRMRAMAKAGSGAWAGMLAIVSGVLGVGCASCGAFVAGTLLSAAGAGAAVALLPLGGSEFALIGIALLLYAIVVISRAIAKNSTICDIA